MFEAHKKKEDEVVVEVTAKKEVEKKLTKVGSVIPHRGHKLFKVHKATLEISEVEYMDDDVITFDEGKVKLNKGPMKVRVKKVKTEKDYAYFSALNVKNVVKKLKQLVDPKEVDRLLAISKK
jgi:hypothetical protein